MKLDDILKMEPGPELNSTNLSIATDEKLIQLAAEVMGGTIKKFFVNNWVLLREGQESIVWNPISSLDDAFELVDAVHEKGDYFKLEPVVDFDVFPREVSWLGSYMLSTAREVDKSRCRAIVKASILAWKHWRELEK